MTREGRSRPWRRRLRLIAAGAWIALAAAPHAGTGRERRDARPVWAVAGEGRGTPAADETTAYFLSKRHELVAIDLTTGVERWRAATLGTGPETMGARVIRASEVVVAGDYDLVAFEPGTGRLRWRFAPPDGHAPGPYLGRARGHQVFAGSASGALYALDARSGRMEWSVGIARERAATTVLAPVVDEGLVVAGFTALSRPARGGIVALDRESGRERWRFLFPAWVTRGAATGAAGEPLLIEQAVVASSQDGTIFGLDRSTGAVRWVIPAGARPDGRGAVIQDFRPLARVGDTLVAGSLSGQLVAYDIETRQERWRQAPVSASVAFGLTADARTVYVPYLSGHLVAIDAETGVERWRVGGPDMGLAWPPLVAPGRLLAAGTGAGFLAFAR